MNNLTVVVALSSTGPSSSWYSNKDWGAQVTLLYTVDSTPKFAILISLSVFKYAVPFFWTDFAPIIQLINSHSFLKTQFGCQFLSTSLNIIYIQMNHQRYHGLKKYAKWDTSQKHTFSNAYI